jgi:hypothetical protein
LAALFLSSLPLFVGAREALSPQKSKTLKTLFVAMMVEPNQLVQHLETFVDTNRSSSQQDDSLKAIASSLENDSLSITQLVREMEMYLTTTDNLVRARGISIH